MMFWASKIRDAKGLECKMLIYAINADDFRICCNAGEGFLYRCQETICRELQFFKNCTERKATFHKLLGLKRHICLFAGPTAKLLNWR